MKLHVLVARLVWSMAIVGGCHVWSQEPPRAGDNSAAPPQASDVTTTPAARMAAMQKVEEWLADPEAVRQIQKGNADELLRSLKGSRSGPSATELRKEAYQTLLKARSDSESFAQKARLLAALARLNKVPGSEIAAAEQLDLQLNPNCADAWMRRAEYNAKEESEKWAQDYFIDGLRRLDLKTPPHALLSSMDLHSWCERVMKAGRADELTDSVVAAFASTEPHQAGIHARPFVSRLLSAPDVVENPSRLSRLLKCVRTYQPHLPRALDFTFPYCVKTLEEGGASALATEVARTYLLSWWADGSAAEATKKMRSETQEFKRQHEVPWIWGAGVLGEKDGMMPGVFAAALREPRGSFVNDLEKLAQEHPDDEELVSAFLIARGMTGQLTANALAGLRRFEPLARMRVAWKLCEHAPTENLPVAEISVLLADGAKVLLQHNANVPGRMPYPLDCLERVMQHLEALDAQKELALLARQFVQRIGGSDGKNRIPLHQWTDLHQMLARHIGKPDQQFMVQLLKEGLQNRIRRNAGSGKWNAEIVHEVLSVYDKLPSGPAPSVAAFAYDAWIEDAKMLENQQLQLESKKRTPGVAVALVKLLLKSGTLDEDKITAILDRLEAAAKLPDMPSMKWATDSISYAKNLMDARGEALPMPLLRVELPPSRGGSAKVAWQMDARSTQRIEEERRLMEQDRGDRMEGVLDVDLLPYLDGKYDLEIYAGAKEELMRPVASLKAVKATGAAEMRGMPVSGWMRAVLKEPRTGTVRFGPAVEYSTAFAVLDSRARGAQEVVQWGQELQPAYGIAISAAVPVKTGAQYLVTVGSAVQPRKGGRIYEYNVSLVALNAQKQPIGIWRLSAFEDQADPLRGNRWFLRTDDRTVGEERWGHRQIGRGPENEDIAYLVLTVQNVWPHLEMEPVLVQPFDPLAKDPTSIPVEPVQ